MAENETSDHDQQLVKAAVAEAIKSWQPPLTEERMKQISEEVCERVAERVAEKVIVKIFGELGLPIHDENAKAKTRGEIMGVVRMHSTAENFFRHILTAVASGIGGLIIAGVLWFHGGGGTPPNSGAGH